MYNILIMLPDKLFTVFNSLFRISFVCFQDFYVVLCILFTFYFPFLLSIFMLDIVLGLFLLCFIIALTFVNNFFF